MQMKDTLRRELIKKRTAVADKAVKDSLIREAFLCSDEYLSAKTVLLYASFGSEIDVDECIRDSLMLKKPTALPVCVNSSGDMEFYLINSADDLKEGLFGIREPDTAVCKKLTDFDGAVCAVPAVAYDKRGFRLGYGRGYYDRFLQKFNVISVGLCYNELVEDELPAENHDIPVKLIITQQGIISVSQEDSNG